MFVKHNWSRISTSGQKSIVPFIFNALDFNFLGELLFFSQDQSKLTHGRYMHPHVFAALFTMAKVGE